MYPSGNLFIPVEHGRLEAILKQPDSEPRAVALVLHPHPLGGGTMHNKVVFRAAAALNDAGLATLRINFRGVGQSTGQHDEGHGELDDARAGLDHLAQHYPGKLITVCGFSFGSLVGMNVGMHDDRVQFLISIGTPVGKYDFGFLQQCTKPLLLVHGENDEFGSVDELKQLIAGLNPSTPVKLVIVPQADHFFVNHLDQLKTAIKEWITEQLAAV
jgi:alpha/beta superfamily hydrolase